MSQAAGFIERAHKRHSIQLTGKLCARLIEIANGLKALALSFNIYCRRPARLSIVFTL